MAEKGRFQFSLRTVLLGTTYIAVILGLIRYYPGLVMVTVIVAAGVLVVLALLALVMAEAIVCDRIDSWLRNPGNRKNESDKPNDKRS